MNVTKTNLLAQFSSDKYNRISICSSEGLLRLLCFEPEQKVPLHRHLRADEYFYVIQGNGKIRIGSEEVETGPNTIIKAPAGVAHEWRNGTERMILLSVLIPVQSYEAANEAARMDFV